MLQSDVEGITSSKRTDVPLSSEQDPGADSVPHVCRVMPVCTYQASASTELKSWQNLCLTKSKTRKALFSHLKTMAA